MLALADSNKLYSLKFIDNNLEAEIELLQKKLKLKIILGKNPILYSIETELHNYFKGKLLEFKTPIHLLGSNFQIKVWQELMKIPSGKTRSYSAIAENINKPTAYRAVANANGANKLAIIIPCHRVINANNKIGGYNGGIDRKQWLIEHEKI